MKTRVDILVVDDEEIVRESLAAWLQEDGYHTVAVGSGEEAIEQVKSHTWSVVFLDIMMPGMDGMEVLTRIREMFPETPVIMITAHASVQTAVQAMKDGAYDYVVKPFDPDEISRMVGRIVQNQQLKLENMMMRQRIEEMHQFEDIIGKSRRMQEVFDLVRRVADSDSAVLITGESGTGKELIARAIHSNSKRKYMPFVAVSLGAMPETLVESALFGHEKGAFTGAQHAKKGRFELADGGTLFLDEIGEVGLKTQVDLLRVLETQQFCHIGGTDPVTVDVRIISATNRRLQAAIEDGIFREDLFYRLNVLPVHLPSLRERKEDIPLLAEHFLKRFCLKMNRRIEGISRRVIELFMGYHWPGNVRELENAIERAVVVGRGKVIMPEDLFFAFAAPAGSPAGRSLRDVETAHVREVLQDCDWNITKAASVLKIDRVTLYSKIKKYALKRD